jgi:arylsulfatase A-like enzyme
MTLFGQSALAARRLIEAGGRFVTLFWDAYGDATAGWDTHFHHYARLRQFLLPGFDQTFSALVLDLEARGLLDETLVICTSEHGRTPRLTDRPGGGREHWSRAYSSVLAGGGIARGNVVGRTDAIGGDVERTPLSPKDILATAFHLLGVDPHTMVTDPLGRPVPIAGEGRLRRELIEGDA